MGFNALFHWLLGFLFFKNLCTSFNFFLHIITHSSSGVWVHIYICKSLIFVWSNVSEIKRILNSADQAPNTWEVSQTKPNQTFL
jgi:hypothetical protein